MNEQAIKSILVVDDNVGIRQSIVSFLEMEGYTASSAENAEDALQRIDNESCDLIIMDIYMPGTDGITAFKVVREKYPRLPVLMISGQASCEDIDCIQAGDGVFMAKPITFKLLLEQVKALLTKDG